MTFNYAITPTLTKANVLAKLDEYDLLHYYVSGFPNFSSGRCKMRSNLRGNDNNESLHFRMGVNGIMVRDFGLHTKAIGVFNYLMQLLGYPDTNHGYMSLLDRIRIDFSLRLESYNAAPIKSNFSTNRTPIAHNVKFKVSQPWDIRYRSRKWNAEEDKAFWYDRYGLGAAFLTKANVIPLSYFFLQRGDGNITFKTTPDNPAYAYVPHKDLGIVGWKRKIYSPYGDSKRKWFNSLPQNTCLSLPLLPEKGDTLLIETSYKDSLVVHNLFENEDIWAVDLFSETSFLSNEVFENLRARFKNIIIHGDNDSPGVRLARQHANKYNINYFINNPSMPSMKDTSDMRHNYGAFNTTKYLWECVKSIVTVNKK